MKRVGVNSICNKVLWLFVRALVAQLDVAGHSLGAGTVQVREIYSYGSISPGAITSSILRIILTN
jgi:hypothetical protein